MLLYARPREETRAGPGLHFSPTFSGLVFVASHLVSYRLVQPRSRGSAGATTRPCAHVHTCAFAFPRGRGPAFALRPSPELTQVWTLQKVHGLERALCIVSGEVMTNDVETFRAASKKGEFRSKPTTRHEGASTYVQRIYARKEKRFGKSMENFKYFDT